MVADEDERVRPGPPRRPARGAAQSLARQLGFSLGPALATTVWALSDYTLTGLRTAFALATVVAVAAVVLIARTRRMPPKADDLSVPRDGAAGRASLSRGPCG